MNYLNTNSRFDVSGVGIGLITHSPLNLPNDAKKTLTLVRFSVFEKSQLKFVCI